MKHIHSVSRFVQQLLHKAPDPPADSECRNRLDAFWKQAMGAVAQHSYPLLFQSGRLVIYCESGAWSSQIRNRLPSLLEQLRKQDFPVHDLSVKIVPADLPGIRDPDHADSA